MKTHKYAFNLRLNSIRLQYTPNHPKFCNQVKDDNSKPPNIRKRDSKIEYKYKNGGIVLHGIIDDD